MGIIPSPKNCFFTNLPSINIESDFDGIEYNVDIAKHTISFKLSRRYDWANSSIIKENITSLRGDIINGYWPPRGLVVNEEELLKAISTSNAPRTPKEKLDNLFLELFKHQHSEGEEFMINELLFDEMFFGKLYFKNVEECNFYLKTLDDIGLIKATTNNSGVVVQISITFKGLNYNIELTEFGSLSRNCFVAMSFGEDMIQIRNAIKQAIIDTGFKPLLIDELHFDAEKTINDEIIASIKKSKFCVADFTEQKDGVYFEAGFALGRGMKVIYACRKDWFEKSHFDTNHFPHIIYNEPNELYEKIKLKIEAWIN
jgi:hypothetical protein